MKIQITQADIEAAQNKNCPYCPTENALIRMGYDKVAVGTSRAMANKDGEHYNFILDKKLTVEILRFDNSFSSTRDFKPGEYEIKEA